MALDVSYKIISQWLNLIRAPVSYIRLSGISTWTSQKPNRIYGLALCFLLTHTIPFPSELHQCPFNYLTQNQGIILDNFHILTSVSIKSCLPLFLETSQHLSALSLLKTSPVSFISGLFQLDLSSFKMELQMVLKQHVGSGNQTCILQKSSQ